MVYQCLIVDDEVLVCELIVIYLEQLDDFQLVGFCFNVIEVCKVLEISLVDFLFLDIEMLLLKGMEFFKVLVYFFKVIFIIVY